MNKPQDRLDLASLRLPLSEEQRDALMHEVDLHGALCGAPFLPVLDPTISDEELIREVEACRSSNPSIGRELEPKVESEQPTGDLPQPPLNELQRRQLFSEVYLHAAQVGAATVPLDQSDDELIAEVKRVRRSQAWPLSLKLH